MDVVFIDYLILADCFAIVDINKLLRIEEQTYSETLCGGKFIHILLLPCQGTNLLNLKDFSPPRRLYSPTLEPSLLYLQSPTWCIFLESHPPLGTGKKKWGCNLLMIE